MSLSTLLLPAGSYLLAIMVVWFAVLQMRRTKSIVQGLSLWFPSLLFAFVSSYALEQSFLFVPDFISHINGIVLLAYFAVEFLVYVKMQGGRTQIYWVILFASLLVVLGLIGGYFVPMRYGEFFLMSVRLPIFFVLVYVLVYIWPTFIHAYLWQLSLVWGAVWVIGIVGYYYGMPELFSSSLHMLSGVVGLFFIVAYLNALDLREYLPAKYYFNTRRATAYAAVVFVVASGFAIFMS